MNKGFPYLLLILIVACENSSLDKKDISADTTSAKTQNTARDSVTIVDIGFYPSFTNSSVLRLNRITGEGVLTVDTISRFTYGRPDTLTFDLIDMESKTDIESFWSSSFIHSLRQDTSMLGWTDGMPVWIMFTINGTKDSVYLGNVYPKSVDSLLRRQIQYLERKTMNPPMKAYLKQVKEYL